jgi:hypothetical protein
MTCKHDHTDPSGLPEFLCRRCHPELSPTPEKLRQAVAREKAQRDAENAETMRKRQLAKARATLDSITKGGTREPEEGSVKASVAKSMRKKIARLEKEGRR